MSSEPDFPAPDSFESLGDLLDVEAPLDWLPEPDSDTGVPSEMPDWLGSDALDLEPPTLVETEPDWPEEPAPVAPSLLIAALTPAVVSVPVAVPTSPAWHIERHVPHREPGKTAVLYGMTFRNEMTEAVAKFHVEHEIPPGLEVIATSPKARRKGGKIVWSVHELGVGDRCRVLVQVVPRDGCAVPPNSTGLFRFSYLTRREQQAKFARPKLVCKVIGPETLRLNETATVRVEIQNTGEGVARCLVLRVELPEGLEAAAEVARLDLADVEPGESIVSTFQARATRAGDLQVRVVLESEQATSETPWTVAVTTPELRVRLAETVERVAGGDFRWDVDVSNTGTAEAEGIQVEVDLPESVELRAFEDENRVGQSGRVFAVGDLGPGRSRLLSLRLRPTLPGDYSLVARVSGQGIATIEGLTRLSCEPDTTLAPGLLDSLLPQAELGSRSRRKRARTAAVASEKTTVQHLIFTLAGTEYAVPLTGVAEIARVPPVFPVPNTPSWMRGVVNLRGDIISLVDLAAFLGLKGGESKPTEQRLLVARTAREDLVAGLVVDRLGGIRDLTATPETRITAPLHDRVAAFVQGVEEFDGGLLVRLDLERLLQSGEMRNFETA